MLSFWQGGSFCALPGLGVKDFRRPWSNVVATQVNPDLAPGRYPGPPTQERRPRISEAKPERSTLSSPPLPASFPPDHFATTVSNPHARRFLNVSEAASVVDLGTGLGV